MSYFNYGVNAVNALLSNDEQSVEVLGPPIRRKTKGAAFARVAAVSSLSFFSLTGVARAEEKIANLSELYKNVADAVVSISAEVTHPSRSNFSSALGAPGSTLEEMLSALS